MKELKFKIFNFPFLSYKSYIWLYIFICFIIPKELKTKESHRFPPKISAAKSDKLCRFLVGLPMSYCSSLAKHNKHMWISLKAWWLHLISHYSYLFIHLPLSVLYVLLFYNPTIHKWWSSFEWETSKQYFSSLMGCLYNQISPLQIQVIERWYIFHLSLWLIYSNT